MSGTDSENGSGSADPGDERIQACLERLAQGDAAARDELITIACDKMQTMAHRMLGRFPNVRRWDETCDVVQNAALRLYKSLAAVTPTDARAFLGFAAVHVRRELLDLARRHGGIESYAANHETNVRRSDGEVLMKVDEAAEDSESHEQIERWTGVHLAAESMPEETREVFQMIWYMGLHQENVAKLLGCSVRTVKRRWEEAKNHLRHTVLGEGST
jgi:RNA polymerase sigma factor (sigma-70 family)